MQKVSDDRTVVFNAGVLLWLIALLAVHRMNFLLQDLNDRPLFSSSEYYFFPLHGPQAFFLLQEFSDRKCTNSWGVTGRKKEGMQLGGVVRKDWGQGEEGSGYGRTVRRGVEHKSSRELALLGAVNWDICNCEGLRGWKRASSIPALCVPHLTTVLSISVATFRWSHLLLCSIWAFISAK